MRMSTYCHTNCIIRTKRLMKKVPTKKAQKRKAVLMKTALKKKRKIQQEEPLTKQMRRPRKKTDPAKRSCRETWSA